MSVIKLWAFQDFKLEELPWHSKKGWVGASTDAWVTASSVSADISLIAQSYEEVCDYKVQFTLSRCMSHFFQFFTMKLANFQHIFLYFMETQIIILLFATYLILWSMCFQMILVLYDYNTIWVQHLSAIYAMLLMSHHAIDLLQGGTFLQWTLLNYSYYANKTKHWKSPFNLCSVRIHLVSVVKVCGEDQSQHFGLEMKVWFILWHATLVPFKAILSFCYTANPLIPLVTVPDLVYLHPCDSPLQNFYSV